MNESEPQPEAKATAPSDSTPQIAKRAYEIHEERGHQSDPAIQDWEQAQREILKDQAKVSSKPEAKTESKPETKTEAKSEAKAEPSSAKKKNAVVVGSLIGTLTMMGTLMLTAMSVARECEQGTFDQLLVTPFRPFEIMAGKAVPNVVIGLIQSTTILLIAQFWFHIPFAGSFFVLYAGLGLFLMAAVGLGLFVSSIAKTMQQAMLYAFLLVMPFALLSGLTTPFTSMPQFLQSVMIINPLRYALDLTRRVYLEEAGFVQLFSDFLPLAVIGLVTLSGAAWLFRRRLT
jgi:ABC-2 type transport system permease protein